MSGPRYTVRVEREEIEVTRDGTFPPYKPDYHRVFVPGLTTIYVTTDGGEELPMSPEQFEEWRLAHE